MSKKMKVLLCVDDVNLPNADTVLSLPKAFLWKKVELIHEITGMEHIGIILSQKIVVREDSNQPT